MALAVRKAGPLKPEAQLGRALSEFEAVLTDEQKNTLQLYRGQLPSTTAAMALTAEIDRENSKKRIQCVGPRLTSVLESVQRFSCVVDTFISGSQSEIAGALWGVVKIALLAATNFSSYFEKLSVLFMDIGRTCPRHDDFALLFPSSSRLRRVLCEYYAVLLRLCRQAVLSSRKSQLSLLSISLLKSFSSDFGQFQPDLETLGLAVRGEVLLASQHAFSQESILQARERQEGHNYRKLGSMFRQKTEQEIEEVRCRRNTKTKLQFLNNLTTHDHRIAWKQARKQGITNWLFEDQKFQTWLHSPESSGLWCTGKLGSGKTVLAANAVEYLAVQRSSQLTLAYMFFRFDNVLCATAALGCIARQLLCSLPSWNLTRNDSTAVREYDEKEDIISILNSELPANGLYVIILDGVDECDKDEAKELMKVLERLLSLPRHNFKLYCSSRPDMMQWASKGLRNVTTVSMSNSKVDGEIARYIELSLKLRVEEEDLQLGDPELLVVILEALLKGAQGMFLWVAFLIDDICEQKTDADILRALQDLPKSLPEVLDRVLCRLELSEHPTAKIGPKIFQWIAASRRPLTLNELEEVLGVEPCQKDWDDTRLVNNMRQTLFCCGSLLTIDEEQFTVHFAHHSIRQHLLCIPRTLELSKYHVNLEQAECTVGEICVTYLNFRIFDRQVGKAIRPGFDNLSYPSAILAETLESRTLIGQLVKKYIEARPATYGHRAVMTTAHDVRSRQQKGRRRIFAFLTYARDNWLSHTSAFTEDSREIWRLWCNLVDGTSNRVELPWNSNVLNASGQSFPVVDWALENNHSALLGFTLNNPELLLGRQFDQAVYRYTAIRIVRSLKWLQLHRLLSCSIPQSLRDELMVPISAFGQVDLLRYNYEQNGKLAVNVSIMTLKVYGIDIHTNNYKYEFTPFMVAAACGCVSTIDFMLFDAGYSPEKSSLGQREFDVAFKMASPESYDYQTLHLPTKDQYSLARSSLLRSEYSLVRSRLLHSGFINPPVGESGNKKADSTRRDSHINNFTSLTPMPEHDTSSDLSEYDDPVQCREISDTTQVPGTVKSNHLPSNRRHTMSTFPGFQKPSAAWLRPTHQRMSSSPVKCDTQKPTGP
ncbi:hypothetical protein MMC13_008283 [Lambiella insularis]|nr:hypothetical protein [Lambiella insularis]